MNSMIKIPSFLQRNRSAARVVDGKLILSFPDAETPTLWQMDLGEAKASALEIKNKDTDLFSLRLKTARGEALEVASFARKDHAVKGLMAAARALEKAHGQINPSKFGKKMKAPIGILKKILIAFGLFFVLFFFWTLLFAPVPPQGVLQSGVQQAPSAAQESGVPLSADDYLRGR